MLPPAPSFLPPWCVQIGDEVDLIVAVERAGPGVDGSYYTMRGLKMDDVVSPLERLLTHAPRAWSIGVGDGGNEVGMAKVTGTQTYRHGHERTKGLMD